MSGASVLTCLPSNQLVTTVVMNWRRSVLQARALENSLQIEILITDHEIRLLELPRKLRTVSVFTRVGHGQEARSGVLQLAVMQSSFLNHIRRCA